MEWPYGIITSHLVWEYQMEFRKEVKSTEILSPLVKFESEVQAIEYREDPLTGSQCRINVARAGRVRQVQQGLSLIHI